MTDNPTTVIYSHLTASTKSRTITGPIVPYGVIGYTSRGPTIFDAGSIEVPATLKRVKLLIQHDTYSAAVGYLASFKDGKTEATATFTVPEGDEGDAALANARDGLRDGLSVGVQITDYSYDQNNNIVVHAARLTEVSLVTIPAFEDAHVSSVAAHRKEHPTMAVKTAPQPVTVDATAEAAPVATVEAAATPAAPIIERAEPVEPTGLQAARPIQPEASSPALDLRAASVLVADAVRRQAGAHEILAALNDIIPANDAGKGFLRDGWAGQLWQAARTDRPLIEAHGTPKPLRNRKIVGWKRDQAKLAQLDPYDGNKGEIGSGDVATIPAETTAQRWAGGWDFDRIYVDLGDPDFVEEVFAQAVEDYLRKSEGYMRAQLLAKASTVVPQTTLTGALAALGLAAVTLGADLSYVQLAPDVWSEFAQLTGDQVPWWLKAQGTLNLGTTSGEAGKIKFSVGSDLPATTVLAGDKRAATFYEVDPPIKATALNIPNGGIDLGVFGYGAVLVHDERAIFKTTVVATP